MNEITPEADKSIFDKLEQMVADLAELTVKTTVTGTGVDDQNIETTINLFDGDTENKIHIEFINNPNLVPIHQFHVEQVSNAHKIFDGNVETLIKLGTFVTETLKKMKD